MNRRTFLEKTSLGSAALAFPFYISPFPKEDKLKIGLIGCGWYGMVITKAALKVGGVEVVAVCDVDADHLKTRADELETLQGARPKAYKDYRELLDHKDLQAVFIGTPPHWHALQFIAACEKGLDIYCEKPLAYDVREGQAMMAAVEKAGNIVQIGFQRRQSEAFKEAQSLISEGKIGKIHQAGAQIHYNPNLEDTTIQAPPASLDWDTWCGPAPKLPYRPNIGHKSWRLEKEYGNGHLVDWGIHHIDIVRRIMGLGMPTSFDAKGGLLALKGKITTPDTLNVVMNFEECPLIWEHRLWGSGAHDTRFNNGVFFYWERRMLYASDRRLVLMPAGRNQEQEEMDIPTEGMQEKHVENFLRAVKAKDKRLLDCPVEDAFQSTATVQLAMASYYTDSEVQWDAAQRKVLKNKAAAKLLARSYRGGYQRPKV